MRSTAGNCIAVESNCARNAMLPHDVEALGIGGESSLKSIWATPLDMVTESIDQPVSTENQLP